MDKDQVAMSVLEEIQQLIQDRIGGGLAPPPPAVDLAAEEGEAAPPAELEEGSDELSADESAELMGMYDAEGVGAEEEALEEEDPLKKKKVM